MTTTELLAEITRAIENAKADLDKALFELDQLPAFDASAVGFVAHAMNNYLTITDATVSLLTHALRGHPNRDVATWLDGLHHTAALMQHTVGRLLRVSTPTHFPLKFEYVNVAVLMERACDYHGRLADRKHVKISRQVVGEIPPAWADRVAVAVIADNLLSNAVKFSNTGSEIEVQVMADGDDVVCTVRDYGAGMSDFDKARFLQRSATLGGDDDLNEPAGFGLRLCKEFLDRMHGTLSIESEPGRGARVSFRLPSHRPASDPRQ
jgi:two-component system sensor histidine kinase/response regulator